MPKESAMRTVPLLAPGPGSLLETAPQAEPVSLVLVCAWCGQPIGRAATSARRLISHGMCRPCLEELLSAEGREFVATGK
jgi:hypothetical protein